MHYREIEIEKNVQLAPEEYRDLLAKVCEGMGPQPESPGTQMIEARLELNGILTLEMVRILHEISNTLTDIHRKL